MSLQRLQKILSQYGVSSRRAAEQLILSGRVAVDGAAAALGQSVDPDVQVITVDGKTLNAAPEKVYIALNKPRGYISSVTDPHGRKTVTELTAGCGARVYPVGRLDLNSDGLLILTNDGEFAKRLTHPSHGVSKTYRVKVSGEIGENTLARLNAPLTVDGVQYGAPQTRVIEQSAENSALLEIVIREGKNREIRNICTALGLKVHRLTRVAVGGVKLGGLKSGAWRELSAAETASLGKV
jgi:23S rRNA pseudouridine2605 synthase